MSRLLMIAALLGGCAVEEREPDHVFSCIITFRCVDDENISARLTQHCAGSEDEADSLAQDVGFHRENEICPTSPLMYVRASCSADEPMLECQSD